MAIYNSSSVTTSLLSALETAAQSFGYDGIIWTAEDRDGNTDPATWITKGFDYRYAYCDSYGVISHSYKTTLPRILVISQGWGDEPWIGSRKTNTTLTDRNTWC
ncbi:MAG: hypothetical protein Q7J78_05275 [Clostridiales bacterium]|nr:hypothetical protein [Clostridiales bacterium]